MVTRCCGSDAPSPPRNGVVHRVPGARVHRRRRQPRADQPPILGVILRAFNLLEVPGQASVVQFAFLLGFQALSTVVLGLYVAQILEVTPLFTSSTSSGSRPTVSSC
jgi:hypothetical protein